MKQEHINEIKGFIILAVGMILLASFISFVPDDLRWYTSFPNIPAHNLIRITGAYLAGSSFFIFGYSAYSLVVFLFFWSWNKFCSREIRFTVPKLISSLVLMGVLSSLLAMIAVKDLGTRFERGGTVGLVISDFLVHYLGPTGAYIILSVLGALALIIAGEFLITPLFVKFLGRLQGVGGILQEKIKDKKFEIPRQQLKPAAVLKKKEIEDFQKEKPKKNLIEDKKEEEPEPKPEKPKITIALPSVFKAKEEKKEEDSQEGHAEIPQVAGNYVLPSLDLLDNPPAISTTNMESNLMSGAKLLEQTLASFGVAARVADIERGPAITRYELEPAPGVKVQKFTALANDIALAMRAPTVRIVAPIPGKNRVGIEVPNAASASVYLKELLMSQEFRSAGSKLTMALGKDTAGKPLIADLAQMPHLMIAGTTGSGKTVCVNDLIMSLLFRATPDEVKFVMVDPKMVELSQYADIPHLLCPPVTDTKKASHALNWVVAEMEYRYKKLSQEGVRNIAGYNAQGNRMPYIVVIIDELADLMQVSAKTVESSITRLAQLSRAVGIHLILATQRPSVDVITGVIKANFPARISFKVASKVDSRTVLDMNGAETLLGKGDMLFIKPGDAKPTRGQCSFVKDEEIHRVIEFIKKQQTPVYDNTVLEQPRGSGPGGSEEKDEFYDEAVKLVIETNQASVSILQRRMRLGYTRAARLIDMMEQNAIVGPYAGSKPRDILVDREKWLLENMKGKEVQTQTP